MKIISILIVFLLFLSGCSAPITKTYSHQEYKDSEGALLITVGGYTHSAGVVGIVIRELDGKDIEFLSVGNPAIIVPAGDRNLKGTLEQPKKIGKSYLQAPFEFKVSLEPQGVYLIRVNKDSVLYEKKLCVSSNFRKTYDYMLKNQKLFYPGTDHDRIKCDTN